MANEFKHVSVGTAMTQAEYESTAGHVLNSQARGDMIYASSTTQLSRLAVGTVGKVLVSDGTDPTYGTIAGLAVSNVADVNVIGGIPLIFRIKTAGGATASITVVSTHKVRIINAWCVNAGLGTASDTITIKNVATAVTDAMDINKADKTVTRVGTLDDAQWEIAAAANLVVTETDGGGSDSPAVDVFIEAIRVA